MRVVLGLGGNLGSRRAFFRGALRLLAAQPGLRILARSQVYETPPLGPPQPVYLNAAVRVEWVGSARGLLAVTQHLEQLLGRVRDVRWGPRTLDIDLLQADLGACRSPQLTLPHPGLYARAFALAPLLDLLPEEVRLAARLSELGGRPPLAQPGWLDVEACGSASQALLIPADRAELAAAVIAASAFRDGGARPCGPRSALPFELRPAVGSAALVASLQQRMQAAARAGFEVVDGVVAACEGGVLRGRFVGTHVGGRLTWAPAQVRIASAPQGDGWLLRGGEISG